MGRKPESGDSPSTPWPTSRKYHRVLLNVEVESRTIGVAARGRTHDVSEGGLLIESPVTFGVDTEVVVRFRLPGGAWIEALGRVRHQRASRQAGLMFVELNPTARAAIADYVLRVRPYTRRSARIPRHFEVLLRWQDLEGQAYEEPAHTLLVSKRGGLAACSHRFKAGEDATLWWPEKERGVDIRIVFRQLGRLGELAEIGFEFKDTDDFWPIQFPPDVLFR